MASKLIALADAIVIALKEHDFAIEKTVERKMVPKFSTKEEGLKLLIVPGGANWNLLTRGCLSADDKMIEVGVFKKLGSPAEAPDFDNDGPIMLDFIEKLVEFFKANRKQATFVLMEIKNDPIFALQKLEENHIFLTVLQLTFRQGN